MRLLITLVRKYPRHSVITLFALLLAGVAEGFGITGVLTLLSSIGGNVAFEGLSIGGRFFPAGTFFDEGSFRIRAEPYYRRAAGGVGRRFRSEKRIHAAGQQAGRLYGCPCRHRPPSCVASRAPEHTLGILPWPTGRRSCQCLRYRSFARVSCV